MKAKIGPWLACLLLSACSRSVLLGALPDGGQTTDAAVGDLAELPMVDSAVPTDATACPDPSSPSVMYVDHDPAKCLALIFNCDPNQTRFDDSCGCGCIML